MSSRASGPGDLADPDALADVASEALRSGDEEAAIAAVRDGAVRHNSARLWQWTGLLQRSLDEHEAAFASFERAAALSPNDPGIAHGRARVALEAGIEAVELFDRARALAPADESVLLGLTAAMTAAGQGNRAADELQRLLELAPGWTAGHEQLAQLLSTLGRPRDATGSLKQAIARFPGDERLWSTLFRVDIQREDYAALDRDVRRAEAAGIGPQAVAVFRAIAAAELDSSPFPEPLFRPFAPQADEQLAVWRIRHLLRVGRMEEALALIERELASARAWSVWPYASLAWRLAGDKRWQWLEGDPRLVAVIDLTAALPALDEIAGTLRKLHLAKGEYLDQSVRGGTQTDGPLLSRIDPVIRRLRQAIVAAVEGYVAQLPDADPRHPLLAPRRDRRIRFSGSWSVRLRGGGRHANHVHPKGWISSALYISLPDRQPGEAEDAGWFTLGEPQDALGVDLQPWRKIEPRHAQLVLFPSWMWHGTVPFAQGERLTVAFDVRQPL